MDIIRKRKKQPAAGMQRLHCNERITPTWNAVKAEWDNLQRYPDLDYYYKEFEGIIGHKIFFTEGISGAVKEIMSILEFRRMEYEGDWALYDIFNKLYGPKTLLDNRDGPVIKFCLFPEADIDNIVKKYDHVIIDDAYQYFHDKDWTPYLKYDNVTIMRTFSKAFGLAGARIGYIIGELVDLLTMHRGGYEANTLSLEKALYYFKNNSTAKQYGKEITEVRTHMLNKYSDMRWDGYSNSLYTKRIDIHQKLLDNNILVKRAGEMKSEIRITLAPMPYMRDVFNILDGT
jgi:histidinol-phosphate/aromatic aminotransferase/cobyric acid decarboxylase-like protein